MRFIADVILAARNGKIPPRLRRRSDDRGLLKSVMDGQLAATAISDREIYAFDRSAINAASDLRIDTPERLERLVEAVLRSPRRIFIESSLEDLPLVGVGMRGVLGQSEMSSKKGSGLRWGAVVDVAGEGRASFRLVFGFPRGWWKTEPESQSFRDQMMDWPKSMKTWAEGVFDVKMEAESYSFDVTRKTGLSKSEFTRALEKIKGSSDPIFQHANRELSNEAGARARAKIVDSAWQALRFRDLVRGESVEADDRMLARVQSRFLDLGRDHASLAFGLPIVAMLALLQANSSDIMVTPRKRGVRKQTSRSGARISQDKNISDDLRVVTLNLEDRDLQGLYESSGKSNTRAHGGENEDTGGRVRHPVRGHLFLARNGKMTWRKPHWRGSLEQATLRKVVAPSHDR